MALLLQEGRELVASRFCGLSKKVRLDAVSRAGLETLSCAVSASDSSVTDAPANDNGPVWDQAISRAAM